MFKNYLELNERELESFIDFVNRKNPNKLSIEEIDKQLNTVEYGFGKGIIVNFRGDKIIGKTAVILKECRERGLAYVINFDICEEAEEKTEVIEGLINEAKNTAVKRGAVHIFLGTRNKDVIETLNSIGNYKVYSAVKMNLEDRVIRHSPLNLIPLSEENKVEFLKIYNESLKEIPNGASLTEEEIEGYIKDTSGDNYYYIAEADNKRIGVLQLSLEEGKGQFDLGLLKSERGKGYGKRLLETAIDFLNSKGAKEINLIVITKNTLAYEMYKKRGFKESFLISDWFEL